jgi:hypothetical protein
MNVCGCKIRKGWYLNVRLASSLDSGLSATLCFT